MHKKPVISILVKSVITAVLLLLFIHQGNAQLTAGDRKKMQAKEDTLQFYARALITDSLTQDRMVSDSIFTRTLVRALQVKNSFYYHFDSLLGISHLYAPDSSFRIFTWNMQYDDAYCRQKGAIQMRTTDGSLRLLPLRDVSEFTDRPEDSARTRGNWIGAMYYNIIKTQYNNKSYYTLFGIDFNSALSSKKWIDVLYFNDRNEPIFGGNFFSYVKDTVKRKFRDRFSLEYKKGARVLVNYIPDEGMILVDHLISETDEPENKWTFIPDGDNEGFKWDGGKWVHIDKVFNYKIDMNGADPYMGNPPVEDPVLDKKGNIDEKKLEQKTEKNKTKEKPVIKDN